MLRRYFLQQWFGLADEALEDAVYDSQAFRVFSAWIWAVKRYRIPRRCSSFATCWKQTA
jgi:hypothetical protein